jgi:hypothetical protein
MLVTISGLRLLSFSTSSTPDTICSEISRFDSCPTTPFTRSFSG